MAAPAEGSGGTDSGLQSLWDKLESSETQSGLGGHYFMNLPPAGCSRSSRAGSERGIEIHIPEHIRSALAAGQAGSRCSGETAGTPSGMLSRGPRSYEDENRQHTSLTHPSSGFVEMLHEPLPSVVQQVTSTPVLILPDLPPAGDSRIENASLANERWKRLAARYDDMSVMELKTEIRQRGLDCLFCFTREDLVARLLESD